jgi:DNA-binding GntR family transcriptional regulator
LIVRKKAIMANKPGKVISILGEMISLIEGGEWGQAGFVPTRHDLAKRFETTTSTINDVFTFLHAMGYVISKGRNVMINPNRMTIPALVPSFDQYLQKQGLTPFMQNVGEPEIISLDIKMAEAFGLPVATRVVRRIRVQGEKQGTTLVPYRVAETYYPEALAAGYLARIKQDPLFVVIDQIAEDTGKTITRSSLKVLTRFPGKQEQSLLQISLHTPIIELFRISYSDDRTMIVFSRIILIGHRFTLSLDTDTRLEHSHADSKF